MQLTSDVSSDVSRPRRAAPGVTAGSSFSGTDEESDEEPSGQLCQLGFLLPRKCFCAALSFTEQVRLFLPLPETPLLRLLTHVYLSRRQLRPMSSPSHASRRSDQIVIWHRSQVRLLLTRLFPLSARSPASKTRHRKKRVDVEKGLELFVLASVSLLEQELLFILNVI